MPSPSGQLEVYGECVVVALQDEALLGGLADLRWRLDDLLARGAATLAVDVSCVERLSSATVATLLWAARRCRARQVRFLVVNPSRSSDEWLRRTGLDKVLDIAGDDDLALATRLPGAAGEVRATWTRLQAGAEAPELARATARRWCAERVVAATARDRLELVLADFVGYATSFAPTSVALGLGWRDPDHVTAELRWRANPRGRLRAGPEPPLRSRSVAESCSDRWGYDIRAAVRSAWFVVDARVS